MLAQVELASIVLEKRGIQTQVEVRRCIAAALAVERVVARRVGEVGSVNTAALIGGAQGHGVVSRHLDGLGLELKRGGVLRERAAGEDVHEALNVGANSREYRNIRGAQGHVGAQRLQVLQARRHRNLRACEPRRCGVHGSRQRVAEDLRIAQRKALVPKVVPRIEAHRRRKRPLKVILHVKIAPIQVIAAADRMVDLHKVLGRIDIGVGVEGERPVACVVARIRIQRTDKGVRYRIGKRVDRPRDLIVRVSHARRWIVNGDLAEVAGQFRRGGEKDRHAVG